MVKKSGNTNFKSTISSYGVPISPGVNGMVTGNIFFVDSNAANASDSNKGTQQKPLLTLDAAIGLCTANNGDIIYLMPGHTESVTIAADIAVDVEGVRIIGLGQGADRPTFTFNTTTSCDIDFDAASCSIENVVFVAGIDSVAAALDINAQDVSILNCEFRDTTGFQVVTWITTPLVANTGEADRLKIENCVVKQNTAGASQFVLLIGGHDAVSLKGNKIRGNYSVSPVANTSTALTNVNIEDNFIENLNAANLCVTLVTTTDGVISDNYFRGTSAFVVITANNDCSLFENYALYTDAKTGKILGTVET